MTNDFDAFVEQFRNEFIETTSERLVSIDDLITSMMNNNESDTTLAEFLRHIHSIKGQGATFDFPIITTIAHRLEDYVETAPEHSMTQLGDIQRFVDIIRKIIESGTNPDEAQSQTILSSLPVTAKGFDDVESIDEPKPIQDVQILLVMPKGTQRKIIGKELAACGFHISNAENPVDAIKYAISHKPDIVIVSRIMEQMGGREFAKVFSDIELIQDCHIVIATTASRSTSDLSDLPETTRVILDRGPVARRILVYENIEGINMPEPTKPHSGYSGTSFWFGCPFLSGCFNIL